MILEYKGGIIIQDPTTTFRLGNVLKLIDRITVADLRSVIMEISLSLPCLDTAGKYIPGCFH